ncbi:Uncharacterised protein [Clostridium putrefaciens]|uniref:Uncharacterized protein n=1 Tax=Clostridium putrefaciens TaxID=99675 RepID=A0A381J6H7_9CLOT|nr:hypothetical protein [Clostridium putrefaciens]SUY45584.1 Uncharacterised protein [Clostridium putrefaciens]
MEENVIIIPSKKKDLGLISKKSLTLGVGLGIAMATTVGVALFFKHLTKNS